MAALITPSRNPILFAYSLLTLPKIPPLSHSIHTLNPPLPSPFHLSDPESHLNLPIDSPLFRPSTKLSESELVAVPLEPDQLSGEFPSASGVYAVYDKNSDLQFIGISRNIAASILGHRKSVPELCVSVKDGVVDEPDRTALTQAWKSWMEEHRSRRKCPTR